MELRYTVKLSNCPTASGDDVLWLNYFQKEIAAIIMSWKTK